MSFRAVALVYAPTRFADAIAYRQQALLPHINTMKNRRKAFPTPEKVRRQARKFQEAHEEGMAALRQGDFEMLGDAIAKERAIIEEQSRLLEEVIGKATKVKKKR